MYLLVIGCLLLAETALCWFFAVKAFSHKGRFVPSTACLCIMAGLVCLTGAAPLFLRNDFVLRVIAVFFFSGVGMLMTAGIDYALRLNNVKTSTCRKVQLVLAVGNAVDIGLLVANVTSPFMVDYTLGFNANWGFSMAPDFGWGMTLHFAWCYAQAAVFTFFVVRRALKVQAMYRAPLVRLLILIGLSSLCNILYSVRGELGPLDYCIVVYGITVLEAYTNVFHFMRGMEYAQVTDVLAQGAPYPVLSFGSGGELLFANAAAVKVFGFEDECGADDPIMLEQLARDFDIPLAQAGTDIVEFQWNAPAPSDEQFSCEFTQVHSARGDVIGYALSMKATTALVDSHTGMYNEDALRAYRRKLQESGVKPVTVAVLSLNHLTAMNERHGRALADEAVWDFARKMKCSCPKGKDCFPAYRGGANFIVLSTQMRKEDVEAGMTALRESIEWDVPSDIVPDFEFAVVEYGRDEGVEDLVAASRKAEELVKLKRLLSPTSHLSAQISSLVRPLIDRGLITNERIENRSRLARAIAQEMGEEEGIVYRSALVAKLCDIGKLSLPDSIAFYKGVLPRGARRLMEQHSEVGYRILRAMGAADGISEGVLHHHERWDGAGYPDGVAGEQIPAEARIAGLACSFDILVNGDGGRLALTPEQALQAVLDDAGTVYDPRATRALAAVMTREASEGGPQAALFSVQDTGSQTLEQRLVQENVSAGMRKRRALVVDDQEINRALIENAIKDDFEVVEATNGQEALDLLGGSERGFDVVLLDLFMPGMNGYEFLEALPSLGRKELPPILVVTSEDDAWSKCLDLGATEFLPKPISPDILLRRVSNAVELYETRRSLQRRVHEQEIDLDAKNEELRTQSAQLARTNEQLSSILMNIMEYRDCDTAGHVERVQGFATALAQELVDSYPGFGLEQDDVVLLGRAAALHDIGKIAIPDHILFKPGMLTPDEMAVMKTHTLCGYQLISSSLRDRSDNFSRFALESVLSHHERWDGSGYPEGLKGSAIPVSAQITALADVYDALTSDRPYKQAISASVAIDMIMAGECGAFSNVMLEVFKKVAPRFEDMYVKELREGGVHDPVEEYRRILQRGLEQGVEVSNGASLENIIHILMDVNIRLSAANLRDRGTGTLSRDSYLDYLSAFDSNLYTCVGAVYFDVNGLHEYNRENGHDQGDVMLANVAANIMEVFGQDCVYRAGGDEFVAICEDVQEAELDSMVQRVRELFAKQALSCSVGYDWRDNDIDMNAMIRSADKSMFQNKERFYSENNRRNVRGGGLVSALD